ncbi:MAG: hypothetical protein HC882_04145, partial [Acidobacteria bacterium]|nr:hypothetical protein [Acidobacteriota bacterium]
MHVWLVVEGVVDRDIRGATLAVADSIPDGRREVAIEVRAHDVGLDAVSL